MIGIQDLVVWTNDEAKLVRAAAKGKLSAASQGPGWGDPIGASYLQWKEMTNDQRVRLMLETALDLAMQGFDLGMVLREFSQVEEFRNLGNQSFPMCRALTKAIVGKTLEPNTMTFDELLDEYRPK